MRKKELTAEKILIYTQPTMLYRNIKVSFRSLLANMNGVFSTLPVITHYFAYVDSSCFYASQL